MLRNDIRILSIIPYKVLPAKLGGEKGIALFNEYLSEIVPLDAIGTKNNDPSLAKGYTLHNILPDSRTRYFNIFLYFRIKKLLRSTRATHLLIEHPYFGWLAWLLTCGNPVKLIVHSHNIEYMRSRSIGRWWWKALRWYEGWVYRKADNVFFISEDDKNQALEDWDLDSKRLIAVTYGIEQDVAPSDKPESKSIICSKHGIEPDCHILLFNGALYHSTNFEALEVILDKINPHLMEKMNFKYKILICGKGLPESFNQLTAYSSRNIIYAGFVDNISLYFKAADVFLNPILSGGGVKTKAIEALAMNCSVVSTGLGALGIDANVCGDKLIVIHKGEWKRFSEAVITASENKSDIPSSFYSHYYWKNILHKAVLFLREGNA